MIFKGIESGDRSADSSPEPPVGNLTRSKSDVRLRARRKDIGCLKQSNGETTRL